MPRLFGTDGVRGVFNQGLDPVEAARLCMAIASYLGEGSRVLVASDYRAGTEAIFHAGVAGLMSSGARVYDAGKIPTPALQLGVRELGFDAGVMFTASHNPPEYVGIKFVGSDGAEVDDSVEEEVEAIYFEQRFRRTGWGSVQHALKKVEGVADLYVERVVSLVDPGKIASKGYRVVVDSANSVALHTSPRILRRLGARVVSLNSDPSPVPSRPYEPTPETLGDLSAVVKAVGADLGVAHDSDADRAIFSTEGGEVVWGDRSAAIIAEHLIDSGRSRGVVRTVVTAVSTSEFVSQRLRLRGVDVRYTGVGIKRLSSELKRSGGLCAFEENGGFVYPAHQMVRDGGAKLALFLEAMAFSGLRASELFSRFPRVYTLKTKVKMERESALKAVEGVKRIFSGEGVLDIDGVRVLGKGWWLLVRPSGTEPVLRIMIESTSEEEAKKLLREVLSAVGGA